MNVMAAPARVGKEAAMKAQRIRSIGRRQLAVTYRPIAELKFDPKNPRTHSPRQLRQIARSIEAFGFNVPILVDHHLKIIAGHGRVMACRQLGWTEVPAITLEHLTEAQARAFMIADNRLTENSVWDDRLLAEQLKELSVLELDFNLETTGFEMGEIDLRIENLNSDIQAEEDPADTMSLSTDAPAVTSAGDVWKLEEQTVLCGNAVNKHSFETLLGKKKASMVFADFPYNLPIAGNVGGFGANHHREFPMASGEMGPNQFTAFLADTCTHSARHTAPGAVLFGCMDWRHFVELHTAGKAAQLELLNVCVWAKSSAGMGSLYRSQHELVFVFRNGREGHRNNIQLGRFGRDRSNLWSYPGAARLRASEEGNLIALHPTVKPVAMIADAIMDVSSRGDIVLDPFLGAGTTVIAAERTGRRCYGIEMDPLYVDTTIRRWQSYTRGIARHASGRTFNEMEAEAKDSHAK
jgi:hypothetical protein